MLRGKSSLFAVLAAVAIAATWSGMGMAADVTPENVGTMANSAKTPEDYTALANYYEARPRRPSNRPTTRKRSTTQSIRQRVCARDRMRK